MILLVAMIGAIVLTFRERVGVKRQSYINQISRNPSSAIELKDVESNKGVHFSKNIKMRGVTNKDIEAIILAKKLIASLVVTCF